MLITGYALTGFMEEALWRGVVLRILRPIGTIRSVVLSSALFGAAHLTNVLFRSSVALVVAQAVGATCFGVGYAALRLRTNTIWPLMVLHLFTDLFAAVGALPAIPILVAQDVILLAYGLWLLRWSDGPDWLNPAKTRTRCGHRTPPTAASIDDVELRGRANPGPV